METKKTTSTTSSEHRQPLFRYGHPAMPIAERAKIFMPFDPFPTYRDRLRAEEELIRYKEAHDLP